MNWLHRLTRIVAGATFLLVVAGGLVTSTGSGLSVPDWPTTYGWSMFTFPYSKWVGGIVYEHGHRLIASAVGLLTIVMVLAYWRVESRRWVKRLALGGLGAVVAQGVLGGITVLYGLPAVVSSAHAGLAEIFFAVAVSLAVLTSPGWLQAYDSGAAGRASMQALVSDGWLRRLAVAAMAVVYVQIILGAVMRHTGAGLAIPDFPLMFGRLVPPAAYLAAFPVAIHFAHRVGALVASIVVLAACWRVFAAHRDRRELVRPAALLVVLIVAQVTLGALTVLSGKQVAINTAHLATGALIWVTTTVLALRAHRPFFAAGVVRTWSARRAAGSRPAMKPAL